jgi:hypothetical protein
MAKVYKVTACYDLCDTYYVTAESEADALKMAKERELTGEPDDSSTINGVWAVENY